MMNSVKGTIQKEEYISIAVNKYILQTGTIPKKTGDVLDWDKLLVDEYLGTDFNKTNPITNSDIQAYFDSNNILYFRGIIESNAQYKTENNYLYNFYTNKIFRVNTLAPENITKEKLLKGTQVLYGNVQKEVVELITLADENKSVKLPNQTCPANKYYYELNNGKLVYKYCKGSYNLEVYQEAPIYLENWEDLQYIKANIGDKAYVKKNGTWYEYYYQGDSAVKWIATGMGDALTGINEDLNLEDRILSYIPDAKDLLLRRDGGCMLANGDIFCWGNNRYKKAGIETSGQMDNTLSADYVNTPVMLKVQIDNIKIDNVDYDLKTKNWYNNPYRAKFEKMALNSTNVCGLSPIFNYNQNGVNKKFGGDLYCNGQLNYMFFEDLTTLQTETSILKRNKFFYWGKSDQEDNASMVIKESEDGGPIVYISNNSTVETTKTRDEIYLKDLVMVEDTIAVLSDAGKIYTYGTNYKGALGIGSSDFFVSYLEPVEVKNTGQVFRKIFALRDIKGFGAIDSNNIFYMWGERPNGRVYTEPTPLSSSTKFNPDAIFVNSKDFVLKGVDNKFYRTTGDLSFSELTTVPSSAISVSLYDHETSGQQVVYIDENMQLFGNTEYLTCRYNGALCPVQKDKDIFNVGLTELNTASNVINGKNYANFANVSVFQLDYNVKELNESFENWSNYFINNQINDVNKYLGRFESGQNTVKTYNFGVSNANLQISLTVDFYEIDSWDGTNNADDYFAIKLNNTQVHKKYYWVDSWPAYGNADGSGTTVYINGSDASWPDEKHTITVNGTLDGNGKLKVEFLAGIGQWIGDESWAVDNIIIRNRSNGTILSNETFEDGNSGGPSTWTLKTYSDTNFTNLVSTTNATTDVPTESVPNTSVSPITQRVNPGTILGRFQIGKQTVEKTFDLGSTYANYEVEVELDFFEIDSWDMERFQIFFNNNLVAEDGFIHDDHSEFSDTNDSGIYTLNLGSMYGTGDGTKYNDERYTYKLKGKLDNTGKLKILMRVRDLVNGDYGKGSWSYGQELADESWGVNNIKIKVKEKNKTFLCAMTGLGSASQMYCWGDVNRSIPILSTSLYDISKIDTINKLFITQDSEKTKQMSYDTFYLNGIFGLRYPTYIAGFDYPFYFK